MGNELDCQSTVYPDVLWVPPDQRNADRECVVLGGDRELIARGCGSLCWTQRQSWRCS